jgi:hypothetical protein
VLAKIAGKNPKKAGKNSQNPKSRDVPKAGIRVPSGSGTHYYLRNLTFGTKAPAASPSASPVRQNPIFGRYEISIFKHSDSGYLTTAESFTRFVPDGRVTPPSLSKAAIPG